MEEEKQAQQEQQEQQEQQTQQEQQAQQEQPYKEYEYKEFEKKENRNMGKDYKKLVKSRNRMLCGVCAGIGEYFNIDPTIVRILFVVFGLWGAGLIAYIIAAVVIPDSAN